MGRWIGRCYHPPRDFACRVEAQEEVHVQLQGTVQRTLTSPMASPASSPAPGERVCSPSIVEVVAREVGSLLSYSPTCDTSLYGRSGDAAPGAIIAN